MSTSGTRRGVTRCLLAAVLFGVSAPAASRLAHDLGAFGLAGLLYLGAALATAPITIRTPPTGAALRRGGRRLAIAVVLGGAVGPVLLAAGLRRTSAGSASLLLNLELVFTTLVAGLLLREHIGRRLAAGTALVALAGGVLAWSPGDVSVRWGALLVAGACLAWAFDNTATAALDELLPAHITFVKGVLAGGCNLLLGMALGEQFGTRTVLWALVIGAFGYGASITLWVSGARDLGAARGQLVFATAPFIGAIVAWTIFGEAASWREVIALGVAAAGVSVVNRTGHEHVHRHTAVEHEHEHMHDDEHHDHTHADGFTGRHSHRHQHGDLVHAHTHVPDLHHRHDHDAD